MRITDSMIIDAVKAAGEEGISAHDIAVNNNWAGSTVGRHLNYISKWTYSPLRYEKKGKGYRWYFQIPKVTVDDPVKEQKKNTEGYSDPTAAKAIKMLERNDGIMPGTIYKTDKGSLFLVMRTYPDTILGYNIDQAIRAVTTDSEVAWQASGATYYLVHTNRLTYIASKRLIKSQGFQKCPFDVWKDIARRSPLQNAKVLPIPVEQDPIKVEVEKEVIKEVPVVDEQKIKEAVADALSESRKYLASVLDLKETATFVDITNAIKELMERPVEVIGADSCQTLDYELIKQRAEIFEYCFNRITGGDND